MMQGKIVPHSVVKATPIWTVKEIMKTSPPQTNKTTFLKCPDERSLVRMSFPKLNCTTHTPPLSGPQVTLEGLSWGTGSSDIICFLWSVGVGIQPESSVSLGRGVEKQPGPGEGLTFDTWTCSSGALEAGEGGQLGEEARDEDPRGQWERLGLLVAQSAFT